MGEEGVGDKTELKAPDIEHSEVSECNISVVEKGIFGGPAPLLANLEEL